MPFTHIKETYFSELIHELTNLDLDHSQFDSNGGVIDNDSFNTKYMRASRYSQFNGRYNDKESYANYINRVNEQCLTELSLLSADECKSVLKRLAIINERYEKAYQIFIKHLELYDKGEFNKFDFEIDFFYLFNIPDKNGTWYAGNEPLKVTSDFFTDLQDALMFKHGALLWLTYHLRDIYGIPQPEGTKTPAESDSPNPDRPNNKKEPGDNAQRKARQAVTLFENRISEIVKREKGKRNPLKDKQVVAEAISKYIELAPAQNLATDEKSLIRYIKSCIGETQTAKKYGGQLVGQERGRK